MTDLKIPEWKSIHTLVFDFDGIFTDNKVFVDQDGKESVRCDRADGLAFDILRNFAALNNWAIDCVILSKESNPVVSERAKKLKIKCIQAVNNKPSCLRTYISNTLPDDPDPFKGVIYFGNDLNDLGSIRLCGFSIVPYDAHPLIQEYASLVLSQKGGDGFVRSAIELILRLNQLDADSVSNLL